MNSPEISPTPNCFFTMTLSPETLLVVLAIAMCSLLLLFSIAVIIVFHCCKVETLHNLPQTMLERTRNSVNWARYSVFSHGHYEEDDEFCGSSRSMLRAQPTPV